MAAVFGQRKESDKAQAAVAISGDGRRFGGLVQLLSASALFAFVVGAVIVFRLVTDRGELIVRSEDPNAHILVKRVDGQPVQELTLQQGQGKLTIRSGQYAVELASDADRWTLSQNQFTISRGDRVVLTVEQKPKGQHQPGTGTAGMAAGESMSEMSSGGMMGGSMTMGDAGGMGGSMSVGPAGGMGGMMSGPPVGRGMWATGGGMSSIGGYPGMSGRTSSLGPGMGSGAGMPSTPGMALGSGMGMMPGVGGAMPGRMAAGATTMPGAMMGGATNTWGRASGGAMGPGGGGTTGMSAMMPGSGAMGPGIIPGAGGASGPASSSASNEQLKSRLVYDGKSYNDWLAVMDTERSPTRLIDAVTAISVLAPEAGSEEAARALLRIMRAFGTTTMDDSPQGRLVLQTQSTLLRLDPSGVAKAIASEIQQGNNRSREFLSMFVQNLRYNGNIPGYGPQPSDGLHTAMIQAVPDIMPMLLYMSHNSDLNIKQWAVGFAGSLATALNLDGQKFPDVVEWFQEALKSEDVETRYEAALALSQLAPDTEGLPDTLLHYLSDPTRRYASLEAIGRLGSHAESIVPQLVEVFSKETAAANTPGMGGGMSGYGGMGGAGTAFPGNFNAPGTPAEFAVLSTLEKLGQVKEAIPMLRKYAEVEGPFKEYARQMLEKLEADKDESGQTQEAPAATDQPSENVDQPARR